MRLLVLVIVTSLGAGPSLAQTNIGGSSAAARPQPNLHDSAVADCRGMWDAGTHMTRQAWSNTCLQAHPDPS
jgi:hypothetical protein